MIILTSRDPVSGPYAHRIPELLERNALRELIAAAIELTIALGEPVTSESMTEEKRAKAQAAVSALGNFHAALIVFAVGINITSLNLRDPKQSAVQGRILADDCRAALVKSNEHELWTASADFFAQFVSADKEWRAVYESGLSLDNSTLFVLLTLHYLLAASLAEPAKAFQLHMAVLGALEQHMAQYGFPSRDLYRLLLPALVIDTWKTKLDEKPFHFGLLPYLRREFSALQNMPRGVGLMKTVLRLVAVGLNAPVKPPQRLWLDSDKSTDLV